MRLIDADELKKKIEIEYNNNVGSYCDGLLGAEELIDNAPTVEPTFGLFRSMLCETCQAYATNKAIAKLADEYTSPQGEWIYNQYDGNPNICNWQCSVCSYLVYGGYHQEPYYKFCPNCGAKMKGGAE